MANKLEINNELITLRKELGKAKVRTIHKISRKLKAAQHGKTKDPKNEKLDKKIIKITEELRMLKNATKHDMVKKIFIFPNDPDKFLKLARATAEERAVCRLLMNPSIKKTIMESKAKLDLKEDGEWKKLIFEMGKNKKRKLRKLKYESDAAADGKKEADADGKKETDGKNGKKSKGKDKKQKTLLNQSNDSKSINRKAKFDQKRKHFMKAPGTEAAIKQRNAEGSVKKSGDIPPRSSAPKDRPKVDKPKPASRAGAAGEKLHPSWEAKKQNKATISNFKGKKTTFE